MHNKTKSNKEPNNQWEAHQTTDQQQQNHGLRMNGQQPKPLGDLNAFLTFPFSIFWSGAVLAVSIPDLSHFSYFYWYQLLALDLTVPKIAYDVYYKELSNVNTVLKVVTYVT